jgi:flavin-dependent dehydrogenase
VVTTPLSADVVIVGAGPAGAAAALMLSPFVRTMLVERADLDAGTRAFSNEVDTGSREENASKQRANASRIGESLPAAAGRLLRDMGLWDDFLCQNHTPCYGRRSIWGGSDPVSTDSIVDPDGPGWHLDRTRFDAWLRAWACKRGAALVAPAKAIALTRDGAIWRLTLLRHGRRMTVTAPYVIDAGGRNAPLARMLGRRRVAADRLVARWLEGTSNGDHGAAIVEAEPEGWWYTADIPDGRRVLAFYTDADLAVARDTLTGAALLARAQTRLDIGPLLEATGFAPQGAAGRCAAHSSQIGETAGPGWIAVGDAALACDPLSSQGLLNALYSGFLAAGAVREALAGELSGLRDYRLAIDQLARTYHARLAAWYGLELRWPDKPFWARRRRSLSPAVA